MTPALRSFIAAALCIAGAACASPARHRWAGTPSPQSATAAPAVDVPAPADGNAPRLAPSTRPAISPPTPLPSPTPVPPPRIISYSIGATVVHPGQTLAGNVRTTPDVVAVSVHVMGFSVPMRKTGPGAFSLAWVVPQIPPLFFRTYTLTAVASTAGGQTAAQSMPVTIR